MRKNLYKEKIPLPDWLFPYLGEIQYQAKRRVRFSFECPKCGCTKLPAKLQLDLGLWQVWWLCPDCLFVFIKRTFTQRKYADEN